MLDVLLIFLVQIIFVPILTLRTVFMVKNENKKASVVGALEAVVYIFGVSLVLTGEQSIAAMIAYSLGFGIGIYIGGIIETKLAIGYTAYNVNLPSKNQELLDRLRNDGYGVTNYTGEGRDGYRYKMEILTKRSRERELELIIEMYEPKAFIISYEPRKFKGGFLVKSMKKRLKKKQQQEQSSATSA
ncbi:DUF2179 domain-containing protein [Pseudalkalibacillus caeni]|uniref:UPF0316 protein FCL54_12625 n=1 Tax=Exobacillus caeni TaxID=2574798 RepID=A0A5R9F386_9BACL|nr:DUF2179 domain-containing protein [Pseudalkalibacillus caeni]TLS36796.1 DUF2179 domain-containing protein [Pseudalkalibacillus caeni]